MRRAAIPLTFTLPLLLPGCFEFGSTALPPVDGSTGGQGESSGETTGVEPAPTSSGPDSGVDSSSGGLPGGTWSDEDTGETGETGDADGDGHPDVTDCDPRDPTVYPGAEEACNGVDDDCDEQIDEPWSELGSSCDGDDPDVCEDGVYVCRPDGGGVICGDGPQTPEAEEVCNGADDDCNGVADDPWVTQLGTPCDGGDADQCAGGVYVCAGDGSGLSCSGDVNVVEICNGNDDDCDGQIDEGCDDDGDDHCDAGMTVIGNPAVCNPALGEDCDDGDPAVNPSAEEICNGGDDDCDGMVDAADADTAWPALDGYEPNEVFFVAPELFEDADASVPFGPTSPTSFHSANEPDYFLWDDVVGPVPPTFVLCHISGMTGSMLVDVELGYRRGGDPGLPYRHDSHTCVDLGNGDTCMMGVAPSFSGDNEYEYTVGVLPTGGIDPCNAEYVLECRLDHNPMW